MDATSLGFFQKDSKLRSLRFLRLDGCSSLGDFPEIECEMAALGHLNLDYTSIKELLSSIGNLIKLENLYLDGSSIKKLASSIGNLTQLRSLYARGCKYLD